MANERYEALLASIGRAGLHSLFPNEIEYYFCALELVDSIGATIDFLAFPVVPNISQNNPQVTNIKKTAGGIVSLSSSTFVPKNITLNGDFGRKFRILLGGAGDISFSAINLSAKSGVFTKQDQGSLSKKSNFSIRKLVFNPSLKTGYGAIKLLQAICDKSTGLDEFGNPVQLFFYNPTLGEEFIVKVTDLNLNQSKEKNMIWAFSLNLKAIAPLVGVFGNSTLTKSLVLLLAQNNIQKGINVVASEVKTLIQTTPVEWAG